MSAEPEAARIGLISGRGALVFACRRAYVPGTI
jgi:hypothetical protein